MLWRRYMFKILRFSSDLIVLKFEVIKYIGFNMKLNYSPQLNYGIMKLNYSPQEN